MQITPVEFIPSVELILITLLGKLFVQYIEPQICKSHFFYLSMFLLSQAAHSNICLDSIEKGQNWQDADAAL